jgi:Protein of unknown function (DUF1559)
MFRSLAILALLPAVAAAQGPTPDLALVPGDALAVLHVRVADVWKTDAMKDVRKVFDKAGPTALAKLDADFTPSPSTLDRVTLVVLPPGKDGPEPQLATILAFSKPYDAAKVRAAYLSKAVSKKAGGKEYLADDKSGIAVHFADDKTMVFSDAKMLPAFLEVAGKGDGALRPALAVAAKNQLTLAINPARLPFKADDLKAVVPDLVPLMAAERLTMTGNVTKETVLRWTLDFPTAQEATAGGKALRKLAEIGRATLDPIRQQAERAFAGRKKGAGPRPLDELPEAVIGLAGLGGLNILDEFLAEPPLTVAGNSVGLTLTLPEWASQYTALTMASAGLALPAVQKVRNAAARMSSSNNLKQIALAMHNFESTHQTFPPAAVVDKKGKKLLSWRVQILPYIEQDQLYKQFKLDEPWDSEHNAKLIDKMPKLYADPRFEAPKAGQTYYKVFVGKEAGFDWVEGRSIVNFTDGTSNTLLVAAGGKPVVWTQPDDFEFDPEKKLTAEDVAGPFEELLVAFCDGSVRVLKKTIAEATLKALITRAGGEVVSIDD